MASLSKWSSTLSCAIKAFPAVVPHHTCDVVGKRWGDTQERPLDSASPGIRTRVMQALVTVCWRKQSRKSPFLIMLV